MMIQRCKALLAAHYGFAPALLDADSHQYAEGERLRLISFGRSVVFQGPAADLDWCREKFNGMEAPFILDGNALYQLDTLLRERGKVLSGEHLRFLRLESEKLPPIPAGFTARLYDTGELTELYSGPKWDNAFNYKKDRIAAAAFVAGASNPVAVAGADDDITGLWQIGIDTLPQYRGRGLGAALTAMAARDIEQRGQLPFYTTWAGNLASIHTALKAGFVPVWLEYMEEEPSST